MFYHINLKKSLKNICEEKLQALCYRPATLPENGLHHRKKRLFPKFVQVHIKDTHSEKAL